MLIIGPMSFVNFTIDNQVLFEHLTESTQRGFLAIFIGSLILSISFFATAIKQKWLPRFISVIAFIAVAGGLFLSLIGVYSGVNEYANEYTKNYEFSFDVEENANITLSNFTQLHKNNPGRNLNIELPPAQTFIDFKKNSNNTVSFSIHANIRAQSEEKANNILSKLKDIQVTQENNNFKASRENGPIFSDLVPFSFLYYNVTISIPESTTVNFNERYYGYIDSVGHCYNQSIFYDKELKKFSCERRTN
jgi:hypothetical protein